MSDEEFQNSNELVPWRWHTSLDPELQWRLDNLKCECGICHNLSGTKDKNCWVFTELGCGFSVAVRKFFAFSSRKSEYVTPIFDPVTKKQDLPLLLKQFVFISRNEYKRMRQQSGILSLAQFGYNLRRIWDAIETLNCNVKQIKQTIRPIFMSKKK